MSSCIEYLISAPAYDRDLRNVEYLFRYKSQLACPDVGRAGKALDMVRVLVELPRRAGPLKFPWLMILFRVRFRNRDF
jgi:hypothetical protein